ncbi:MAG: hypothetical protein LBS90_01600 [Oscillospiraceae bacterium]|jgi:hypothetical protein|nr:hypothetical protein [Oscillospiraceae bacterium]
MAFRQRRVTPAVLPKLERREALPTERLTRGVAPIEKNRRESGAAKTVAVTDEFGIAYEPTYPKRARGLVKSGRARYINEKTICLTRPPELKTEDDKMSNNNKTAETGENTVYTAEPQENAVPAAEVAQAAQSAEIVKRLDAITADNARLKRMYAGGNTPRTEAEDDDWQSGDDVQSLREQMVWKAQIRSNFENWAKSYIDYSPGDYAVARKSFAQLTRIELMLNPDVPSHNELSKALSDATEGRSADDFGKNSQTVYEITQIVKRVLNEPR